MNTPKAVQQDWPSITVGGRTFTLRLAYAAYYKLQKWGKNIATADSVEIAAAAAGTFDRNGNWRSEGFDRATDLADLMTPEDETNVMAAVIEALKKVAPPEETVQPEAAKIEALDTI